MSDRSDAPEGWGVRQRLPVLVAAGVVTTLVLALVIAGHVYDRTLRSKVGRPHATFPAPGLVTSIHDGDNDPHFAPAPPAVDPRIVAAKREVLATGLDGWKARE